MDERTRRPQKYRRVGRRLDGARDCEGGFGRPGLGEEVRRSAEEHDEAALAVAYERPLGTHERLVFGRPAHTGERQRGRRQERLP